MMGEIHIDVAGILTQPYWICCVPENFLGMDALIGIQIEGFRSTTARGMDMHIESPKSG